MVIAIVTILSDSETYINIIECYNNIYYHVNSDHRKYPITHSTITFILSWVLESLLFAVHLEEENISDNDADGSEDAEDNKFLLSYKEEMIGGSHVRQVIKNYI